MPSSARLVGRSIQKVRISTGVAECILVNGVGIYGGAAVRQSRELQAVNIRSIRVRKRQKKWKRGKLWELSSRKLSAM